jgi:hypothetical protein
LIVSPLSDSLERRSAEQAIKGKGATKGRDCALPEKLPDRVDRLAKLTNITTAERHTDGFGGKFMC